MGPTWDDNNASDVKYASHSQNALQLSSSAHHIHHRLGINIGSNSAGTGGDLKILNSSTRNIITGGGSSSINTGTDVSTINESLNNSGTNSGIVSGGIHSGNSSGSSYINDIPHSPTPPLQRRLAKSFSVAPAGSQNKGTMLSFCICLNLLCCDVFGFR